MTVSPLWLCRDSNLPWKQPRSYCTMSRNQHIPQEPRWEETEVVLMHRNWRTDFFEFWVLCLWYRILYQSSTLIWVKSCGSKRQPRDCPQEVWYVTTLWDVLMFGMSKTCMFNDTVQNGHHEPFNLDQVPQSSMSTTRLLGALHLLPSNRKFQIVPYVLFWSQVYCHCPTGPLLIEFVVALCDSNSTMAI